MPRVYVLDSNSEHEWNSWYNRLPVTLRDIHFSYAYHKLYEVNGDGRMRLFIYEEGDDFFFYPYLLRSIPGEPDLFDIETVYGYTGPLSTNTGKEFLDAAFLKFAGQCLIDRVICEFVRYHPLLENHVIASGRGYDVIHLRDYVCVELERSVAGIEAAYSSANRNKIRKAEKLGMVIREDASPEAFADFVSIYLDNMKRLSASPMYFFSDRYFDGLRSLSGRSGMVIHAVLNGKVVGSTVFLVSGNYGHYFLSSATEEGRRNAAGNLMLAYGIRRCRELGVKRLHLGGGLTGEPDDALLQFKRNFSPYNVAFFIGKRIHMADAYQEVVKKWEVAHPEKAVKLKGILQRYRMV